MADSLVLANGFELLGGGVPSQIPACAGAVFRLAPGFDLDGPKATSDYVASILLDGSRPFGRRADDRLIKLPIAITGPDRATLIAARETIEAAADQDQWTITWIPDPGDGTAGLPLLLDCYRAQEATHAWSVNREKQLVHTLQLVVPALPYARSDVQTRVPFPAPVPGSPPPPPAPVLLDDYSTISSPQHYQSTRCVRGPRSLCWDPDDARVGDPGGRQTEMTYAAQLAYTTDLTGMAGLQMYLGMGSRYYHCLEYHGHVHGVRVYVTLTDVNGGQVTCERVNLRLPVSPQWTAPAFSKVTMAIPQGVPGFDPASVASYAITIVNRDFPRRLAWVTAYIDELTAQPGAVQSTPVTRGAVLTLHGVGGTARTAASLSFIQPPTAGTPTALTTPGVGLYTVPAGTAWLKVECVGGGGPGATRTTAGLGGGGGGAEYAREDIFPCAAGQQIPYSVPGQASPGSDGAAATFGPGPDGPLAVIANGGKAAAQNSTQGGLPGDGSQASVRYPGGTGRTASGNVGGGGASSAGYGGPGQSPAGTAADVRTAAGAGTWTCPQGVSQVFAEVWGSGGSGATGSASNNGAAGGAGEYAAGYIPTTPGTVYNLFIAAGGTAASGTGLNGNDGAASWFEGDGGQRITANGGKKGLSRSYSGGGGQGGSGSTAPVRFSGGSGGGAMPYSGGGGSSAGPSAPGNPGDGYGNPGTPPTDGGAGGAGSGATFNNGGNGAQPGGGGGGTYSSTLSGKGGDGKIRLTYPGGAPTSNGAAAVPGGGAGGNGGSTPGQAGSDGQQPGGGGGGADSSGSTVQGGKGGGGKITITPYASQPSKSLLMHRPPFGAPKTYQPFCPVGGGADVPNGATQYQFPQPVAGVNAGFAGSYTVLLAAASWAGGPTSPTLRTITVAFTQWEYQGGPGWQVPVQVTVSPSQVVNNLVTVGVAVLPAREVPPDNTQGLYTVAVTSTQTGDRFNEVIVIDTMGQTILLNSAASGYISYWADAPDPNRDYGYLLGSQTDRAAAVSVAGDALMSGGPLHLEPAESDNLLVVYSADGVVPNVGLSYYQRWRSGRTS